MAEVTATRGLGSKLVLGTALCRVSIFEPDFSSPVLSPTGSVCSSSRAGPFGHIHLDVPGVLLWCGAGRGRAPAMWRGTKLV